MYLLGIYNLNKRTAYKVDYNIECGYRYQEKDGFYYLTGEAKINAPNIKVMIGKYVMDEELGCEVDFTLEMHKHLFGKKDVFFKVGTSGKNEIGELMEFDEDFNFVFSDPDNIDYNKKIEEICARHQDVIDELILQADILWDIK